MKTRHRNEAGDTLVEIIIAVVIMGIVVSALLASFATASTASRANRDLVTADAVLRNSAEATKLAVRNGCSAGATYSVTYTAPAGFTPPANVTNHSCPPVTGSPSSQAPTVTLTVTLPSGIQKSLSIAVRTP